MTLANYRLGIRAAVRGFWSGVLEYADFLDAFGTAIERGLTRAWHKGAAECGIRPEEMTGAERAELQRHIIAQRMLLGNFADRVYNSREPERVTTRGTPLVLRSLFHRAEMWVNYYRTVQVQAAAFACANKKKVFRLGPTKAHCKTCGGLAGRVYRYEVWAANGALPPSRRFDCGGYNCLCYLDDTDQRVTPGRFPSGLMVH